MMQSIIIHEYEDTQIYACQSDEFWPSNATVPDAPRVRLMLMSARNLVFLVRSIIPEN